MSEQEEMEETMDMTEEVEPTEEVEAMEEEVEQQPQMVSIEQYNKLKNQLDHYANVARELKNDFENFKRHMQKNLVEKQNAGVLKAAEAIFPALDSFKKAKKIITDKSCLSGIKMIEKQILSALETLKIRRIKSVGEVFDPEFHNAVMMVEEPNVESGIIVEELESGYTINDRVVRFSNVIVAK